MQRPDPEVPYSHKRIPVGKNQENGNDTEKNILKSHTEGPTKCHEGTHTHTHTHTHSRLKMKQ